jgi:hypothetical protein
MGQRSRFVHVPPGQCQDAPPAAGSSPGPMVPSGPMSPTHAEGRTIRPALRDERFLVSSRWAGGRPAYRWFPLELEAPHRLNVKWPSGPFIRKRPGRRSGVFTIRDDCQNTVWRARPPPESGGIRMAVRNSDSVGGLIPRMKREFAQSPQRSLLCRLLAVFGGMQRNVKSMQLTVADVAVTRIVPHALELRERVGVVQTDRRVQIRGHERTRGSHPALISAAVSFAAELITEMTRCVEPHAPSRR